MDTTRTEDDGGGTPVRGRGQPRAPLLTRMAHWLRLPHNQPVMEPDGVHPDDPEVVRAVQGEVDALEALLEAAGPRLRGRLDIAPRWSRSLEVDDVLQVTFTEAFLRIQTLRGRSRPAFDAWIGRIAENNLNDAVRALDRDKRPDARRRVTAGDAGESSRTLLARVAPTGTGEATRLARSEEVALVQRAVARLPRSYRDVITALDLEERSVAEVAEALGRSHGAIHMLHSRALDRLRELVARSMPAGEVEGE